MRGGFHYAIIMLFHDRSIDHLVLQSFFKIRGKVAVRDGTRPLALIFDGVDGPALSTGIRHRLIILDLKLQR